MDIRLLRFFVAVYEERNFTGAARRCNVSQPSISTSIRSLEEELGAGLFLRHKKGVTPTDEAEYLYPMALRMLGDLNRLPEIFREKRTRQKLTLSLMPDCSKKRVARLLQMLKEEIPALELELVDFQAAADARLTLDVLKAPDEIFLPLWEEDYLLCLPEEHPLAEMEEIGLEDLHGFDFLECPPCEAHHQMIGLLACCQRSLNIVARAEHKGQVLNLVMAGIGMSFLPEGLVENQSGVVVRPFSGQRMFRRIGLTYPSASEPCPALAKMLLLSRKIAEELERESPRALREG